MILKNSNTQRVTNLSDLKKCWIFKVINWKKSQWSWKFLIGNGVTKSVSDWQNQMTKKPRCRSVSWASLTLKNSCEVWILRIYLLQIFNRAKATNGQTMTKAVVGPESSPKTVTGVWGCTKLRSVDNFDSKEDSRFFTCSISQLSCWIAECKALLTSNELPFKEINTYQNNF